MNKPLNNDKTLRTFTYIGATSNLIKVKISNHMHSFKNERSQNNNDNHSTYLTTLINSFKDKKIPYSIKEYTEKN